MQTCDRPELLSRRPVTEKKIGVILEPASFDETGKFRAKLFDLQASEGNRTRCWA